MARSLTRTDFFEAGLDLLSGASARLTIAGVCSRLAVTTGSFYHHFANGEEFLHALVEYWRDTYALQAHARARAVTDVAERIDVMRETAIGLRHEAEAAIRSLAATDPLIADVQRQVDRERRRLLAETLRAAGVDTATARRLARVGVSILIGAQQTEHPVDRARLRDTLLEYQRWVEATVAAAD